MTANRAERCEPSGTSAPRTPGRAASALRSATCALLAMTPGIAWLLVDGSLGGSTWWSFGIPSATLLLAAASGALLAPHYVQAARRGHGASIRLGIWQGLLCWLGAALLAGGSTEDPWFVLTSLLVSGVFGGLVTVPFAGFLLGCWQHAALAPGPAAETRQPQGLTRV